MGKETKRLLCLIGFGALLLALVLYMPAIWRGFGAVLGVLRPLFIAIAIAFVLNVPMALLERRLFDPWAKKRGKWAKAARRPLALLSTLLLVAALLYGLFGFVLPQFIREFSSLATAFPGYMERFSAAVDRFLGHLYLSGSLWDQIAEYGQQILSGALKAIETALPALFGVTVGIGIAVTSFFLGLVFAIYMLLQKEKLTGQAADLLRAFLPKKWADGLFYVGTVTNASFRSFVGGQLLEALIIGSLTYLGMTLFRMPYAPVIAVIIGVSSLVPIVGAIIGTVPSAFLLFLISPMQALGFIVFIIVLQQVEGNLIYPKVVGGSVGLSGFWVLFAILIGGGFFGILGMLVAVPVAAVTGKLLGEAVQKRLAAR